MDHPRVIFAALLAALALGALLSRVARRRWIGFRARRRLARAAWGEKRAERLLAARGYVLEQRQPPARMTLLVDGEPTQVDVRVDLLVTRGGRRFAAEVKTGARAPRLDHAPTRRQLLEYAHAYDVDGLLLVDAETGTVREVRFPGTAPARAAGRPLVLGLALGLVIGGVLGWATRGPLPGTIGTSDPPRVP